MRAGQTPTIEMELEHGVDNGQGQRQRHEPTADAATSPRSSQDPFREPPILAEPVDEPPTLFRPQEFAGGRVRVYGCSPGCLIVSVIVSLILSLLLTALVNAL